MSGTSRFDCFPSDFLNGVIGLPADAIAVYTIVMMLQYDRGVPVKYAGREREIAIRSGMSAGRLAKAVAELIDLGKLHSVDGCLTNHRVEREIVKISEKIAKNRENSQKGGETTRKKFEAKDSKINGNGRPNGQPNGQPNDGPNPSTPFQHPKNTSSLRSEVTAKQARKSTIADDAQPDEIDRKTADDAGMDAQTFRQQWALFRDHHRSVGSLMLDWHAAWRKWCGNWPRFATMNGHANGSRASPGLCNGPTMAELSRMDSPSRHPDEPGNYSPAKPKPDAPDPQASGFAGRFSVEDRGHRNGQVLDLLSFSAVRG